MVGKSIQQIPKNNQPVVIIAFNYFHENDKSLTTNKNYTTSAQPVTLKVL